MLQIFHKKSAADESLDFEALLSLNGSRMPLIPRAQVQLSAPGVAILSTLPGGQMASWSGTSMATPFVSTGLFFRCSFVIAFFGGGRLASP